MVIHGKHFTGCYTSDLHNLRLTTKKGHHFNWVQVDPSNKKILYTPLCALALCCCVTAVTLLYGFDIIQTIPCII